MLKGVATSMSGPKISHLFFVDDNLIFCRTTHEDCATLENILETYCRKPFLVKSGWAASCGTGPKYSK